MRKIICVFALALAACLFILPNTTFAATFIDVPEDHWAYEAVEYFTSNNIMTGYLDGSFQPDLIYNRAQMAVMLCRVKGYEPYKTPSTPIPDVADSVWYTESVNHAVTEGWMIVDADGRFNPFEPLTRQEIALAAAYFTDSFNPDADYSAFSSSFIDIGDIDPGYINAVGFNVYAGMIKGFPDGSYQPNDTVTRAMVAVIIYRALTLAEPIYDTYTVTLKINKDGLPWIGHGKTFECYYWTGETSVTQPGSVSGSNVTFSAIPNGCWFWIYDTLTYDGISGDINNADVSMDINYYTVSFAAIPAGDATGGSIFARYRYESEIISSGAVIMEGRSLILSAAGSGANWYSFDWDDSYNTISPVLYIYSLYEPINLTCTITGDNSRQVSSISITRQPNLIYYSDWYSYLDLRDLTVELTISDGTTSWMIANVTYEDFNRYGILVSIDGEPVIADFTVITTQHQNMPIMLSVGGLNINTERIQIHSLISYYSDNPEGGPGQSLDPDIVEYGGKHIIRDSIFPNTINYAFDGWEDTDTGACYMPGDIVYNVTYSMSMYARWRSLIEPPPYINVLEGLWFAWAEEDALYTPLETNTSWIASSNSDWLTVDPTNGSAGLFIFRMSVTANSGFERSGTITISAGEITRMIDVTQEGRKKVTRIEITEQPRLTYITGWNDRLDLTGLTVDLTVTDGEIYEIITGVTYESFSMYGIQATIYGEHVEHGFTYITARHHNKLITLTAGEVYAKTNPITLQHTIHYDIFWPDAPDIVISGDSYTVSDNKGVERIDYEFEGWVDMNTNTYYNAGEIIGSVTDNIYMYSRWRYLEQQTYTVSGMIKSYNPKQETTVKLLQGINEMYETVIPRTTGSGQLEQPFTFDNVKSGEYTLVVTKTCHTPFTVSNIIVGEGGLDLTLDSRPEVSLMTLRCGDIDGNGLINDLDLTVLWMLANYNRNVDNAAIPACDLNGDGMINDIDLTILWMHYNYNKGEIVIQ